MSNFNINTTKKLGLTSIKKYQKYTDQIKIELYWLYNWI